MSTFLYFFLYGILLNSVNSQSTVTECTGDAQCASNTLQNGMIECSGCKSCEYASITSKSQSGYIYCTGSESCQYSTLEATKNISCIGYRSCYQSDSITADNVQCPGSGSCEYATSLITSTSLYCGGERACYGIVGDRRTEPISVGNQLYCHAAWSCTLSTINTGDNIYCTARYGCTSTTITTSGNVVCGGEGSCGGADILQAEKVKIYGYSAGRDIIIIDVPLVEVFSTTPFGSYRAKIDSGSLTEMKVKMFGYTATGGVVICRDGAQCIVHCKGNGCLGLEYRCQPGAICNIIPIGCLSGADIKNGIDCPSITNSTSNTVPIIIKDEDDIDQAHKEPLLTSDVTVCGEENSCYGQTVNDSDIECDGLKSCQSATLISNGYIWCGGKESCLSSNIIKGHEQVWCTGQDSCKYLSIRNGRSSDTTDILYCSGVDSCRRLTELSVTRLYCAGTTSCKGLDFIPSEIYRYGYYLRCTGDRSCQGITLDVRFDHENARTFCSGNHGCSDSEIFGGYTECKGKGSCLNSIIKQSRLLKSFGFAAAFGASIYGEAIQGLGYLSLAFATIDSNHTNSNSMTVSMSAHYAGYGATVICRRYSECTLSCYNAGCKNVDYICVNGANCTVLPDGCSNGTDKVVERTICPNILTSVSDENVNEFLERKKIETETDVFYIMINDEHDGMYGEDVDSEELFDYIDGLKQEGFVLNVNSVLFLGLVGIVFVISIVLYLWNRMKYDEYEILK